MCAERAIPSAWHLNDGRQPVVLLAADPVVVTVKVEFVMTDDGDRAHIVGAVPAAAGTVVIALTDHQAGPLV